MNTQSTLKTGTAPESHTEPAVAAPLNTKTLFPLGSRERTIVHDNTEYRLRITAQGKLILTK
ncbi:MAG: hemin uptake protein HemP [Limnobacter sp.]|uniref:hemin uptake protein HemP n=1 Tax=Limnobacter TaxID=131079 RepID=UPI001203D5A1|nr:MULTISPECIES: hemin uptake protein HemP [unclassified Limnobacter]RZO91009.1 MAG: hemin uptake protein HemP [Limnobacter sp.]